ncbi:hypothetical protein [Acidisarcina polymorpha]|uniref:hypothetical protein n=1 Tax=Acidisarcina polymorpha TaxID=2211140 RepID=UPI001237C298|nr:hypothetical protein [Acidisarcina polymorpha]
MNLRTDDGDAVIGWLGAAGYVPFEMLEKPESMVFSRKDVENMSSRDLGWREEFLTPAIRQRVQTFRDVFAWLIGLNGEQFRNAIGLAKEYGEIRNELHQTRVRAMECGKNPRLKDPAREFIKEVKAPSHLDPETLGLALRGTGTSEVMRGKFSWDSSGSPHVVAEVDSPMAAVCISIHLDRNFSSRGWVQCVRCSKWLDKVRGRDRFCSSRCRNYVTTTARRGKIRLLKQAAQQWEKLTPKSQSGLDRWQWIAEWVTRKSKSEAEVEANWVMRELTKIESR